jgi:hypothetical protein
LQQADWTRLIGVLIAFGLCAISYACAKSPPKSAQVPSEKSPGSPSAAHSACALPAGLAVGNAFSAAGPAQWRHALSIGGDALRRSGIRSLLHRA